MITFNTQRNVWTWDIKRAKSLDITNNVVDLMVGKLNKLPPETRDLLRLGSCIGNIFDLKTLAIISSISIVKAAKDLWPAVKEGMIMPLGDGHHMLHNMDELSDGETTVSLPEALDKFHHDRVQQAAYTLIEEGQKKAIHLKIARILLKETSKAELENKYFDIVEHYNKSSSLIDDEKEKITLAELNLKVGKKAKESTAYGPALQYFKSGVDLLSGSSQEENHKLTFQIHKGMTECQFLIGKDEDGINSANELMIKSKTREEKIEINNILILYYGGAGQMDKSIDIAIDSLRLYNERLPRKCNQVQLLIELATTKIRELNKNVDYLINMPCTKNSDVLNAFSLLKELVAPTYLQGLLLLPFIILRMFKLTLKHGNSSTSSFIFSAYGLLWSKLGIPSQAYKYGKLAMEYNKLVDNPPMEARTYFMVTSFAMFWKQPVKDSIEPRKQGLQKLVNTGENFWASYIYLFGFWQEVSLTGTIDEVVIIAEREVKFAKKVKQTEPFFIHTLHRNLFLNLKGDIDKTDSLDCDVDDERNAEEYFSANVTSTCGTFYHATTRLVLNYYYENYKEAVVTATGPKMTAEVIADPTYNVTIYTFFTGLAIMGAYAGFSGSEKRRYRKIFNKGKKKIQKWHRSGPENFECMLSLTLAEEARIDGNHSEARDLYTNAIKASEKMDSYLYKSLAYELYAKFWISVKEDKIARTFILEAGYLYQCWGANAKLKHLKENYSQYYIENRAKERIADSTSIHNTMSGPQTHVSSTTSSSTLSFLDTATVIKASQAISGEIVLNNLLEKLMRILIENAGARKGMLILKQNGRLIIEAEGEIDNDKVNTLYAIPLEESESIPVSIINYTARTEDTVVLNNAVREGNFTTDNYIVKYCAKSIISMPIINQGKLIGILYLENGLIEGAFTTERLELLEVLSSQAAISIENAIFYNTLEKKVEERTSELKEALEDLKESQSQLVQSEKMASLGQLIAGIAHEINTPMGAIKSSAGNITDSLTDTLNQLPRLFQTINDEQKGYFYKLLEKSTDHRTTLTTREERKIRKELLKELEHHEIKDAKNFANIFVKLNIHENVEPYIPLLKSEEANFIFNTAYKISDLKANTINISMAIEKASKIIFALKNFSRHDDIGEMVKASLKDGIETVLVLYHNQIKQNTELIKRFEDVEEIDCLPDELNQVWTNLITNALQAMEYRGTLSLGIRKQDNYQVVSVTDSGSGMSDEVKEEIFKPFFTTKRAGEGSGLGLDIVKNIVDKHKGKIEVESEIGKGTTFSVFIPM